MSIIETLRAKIRQHETSHAVSHTVLPFGVPGIDARLPGGGLKYGALHEIAGSGNSGAHGAAAALFAAGILARTQGQILWCIKQRDLFAPALTQVGLGMERVIFVEAGDEKTLLACFEEGLRHGGVIGVVGELSKLSMVASRRLQLAAETTGAIGIAIGRWWRASDGDSWGHATAAHSSWRVTALPSPLLPVQGVGRGRWRLDLVRCRGGEQAHFDIEACDEKGNIALSAILADGQATPSYGQRASA